jgi:hypothetical protein
MIRKLIFDRYHNSFGQLQARWRSRPVFLRG